MYQLAFDLKMTVRELSVNMGINEFNGWVAFYESKGWFEEKG